MLQLDGHHQSSSPTDAAAIIISYCFPKPHHHASSLAFPHQETIRNGECIQLKLTKNQADHLLPTRCPLMRSAGAIVGATCHDRRSKEGHCQEVEPRRTRR